MTTPAALPRALADALAAKGYDTLTPVQEEMTRPDLAAHDLLVSAQTGSGKTVGFGLALAPTLLEDADVLPPAHAPLALVIAPTRELALQVRREFEWLYEPTRAVMGSCVGGMDMRTERRTLERGTHIVVGTPGRLRDHIQRGSIDLSAIRAVVLDEADEMLDLGFAEDLEFILSNAPDDRRTLMFSATVPKGIEKLSKTFMNDDAQRIRTTSTTPQHSDIEYRALSSRPEATEAAVINTLRYYDAENAIVFANTRATVNRLTTRLSNRGFQVVALSGELSQQERSHALQAMRDGRARVCVATDVAARGIDLPGLDLVVHAELPNNSETLLHRSGRTGRAGRKGVSALVVTHRNHKKADRLLRFAKVKAEWGTPPSADDVREKDRARVLADPVWDAPAPDFQEPFIAQLVETYSPEQLAKAFLALQEAKYSAPEEIAPDNGPSPKAERAPFGPSGWVSLAIGRNDKAEPRWLLPMVCRVAGIEKSAIGAIRITDKETFVELQIDAKDSFMSNVDAEGAIEQGIKVTALEEAPKLPERRGPKPGGKPGGRFGNRDRDDRGDWGDRGERGDRDDRPDWRDRKKGNKPGFKRGNRFDDNADRGDRDFPPKRKPRDPEVHGDAKRKPRKDRDSFDPDARPAKPKPPKKPKGDWDSKPGGKPAGKAGGKPSGKSFGKPGGKPAGRSSDKGESAKPHRKGPPAGASNASDPSKSLKRGKPRQDRGANAMPKRRK